MFCLMQLHGQGPAAGAAAGGVRVQRPLQLPPRGLQEPRGGERAAAPPRGFPVRTCAHASIAKKPSSSPFGAHAIFFLPVQVQGAGQGLGRAVPGQDHGGDLRHGLLRGGAGGGGRREARDPVRCVCGRVRACRSPVMCSFNAIPLCRGIALQEGRPVPLHPRHVGDRHGAMGAYVRASHVFMAPLCNHH